MDVEVKVANETLNWMSVDRWTVNMNSWYTHRDRGIKHLTWVKGVFAIKDKCNDELGRINFVGTKKRKNKKCIVNSG